MDNNELNLKQIIIGLREYIVELFRKWWVIVIVTALIVSLFMYKHFNTPITYDANIKFALEGGNNSAGGLVSGLLGNIGVGNSSSVNPFKVQEVGKSNFLADKILKSEDSSDKLGNTIIDIYNLKEIWSVLDPDFNSFTLSDQQIENASEIERSGFKRLKKLVWGTGFGSESLLKLSYEQESGVFDIYSETLDEKLSYDLAERTYDYLKEYFEEQSLQNQIGYSRILKSKLDSIDGIRNTKSYDLARINDSTRGLTSSVAETERTLILQELQALTMAYGELLRTYEVNDVSIRDRRPLFILLDAPLLPLDDNSSSLLISLILGLIAGLIVSVLIIVISKFFRDTINS